jgi:hypothetical protein
MIPEVYNRQRNKTFFFGSMEWQRISRGSTATGTVPTAAMLTGTFSGQKTLKDPNNNGTAFPENVIPASRIAPNGAAYAALHPLPTQSGTGVNFIANPWSTSNLRQELIRADHQLTVKNLLTFRGSANYYEYVQPGNVLGYNTSYRHSRLYTFGTTLNAETS